MPKFYEHWSAMKPLPEASGAFDCNSCFMLKPHGRTRDLGPFTESLKCCTFQPFLPAFTIGALIKHESVSFEVLERYLSKSRLSPIGAFPKQRPTSVCETGKHEADGCTFLSPRSDDDARTHCTIRDFRPSTCAGYVCRTNLGENGLKAWSDWEKDLASFEWTLAHLAGFELGRTFDDIDCAFSSTAEAREYYVRAYKIALELKVE